MDVWTIMPPARLRPRVSPQAGSGGFSLTEILIALSVLAVAVIGLVRAFDVSLAWSSRSNDRTVAANLAQQRLEQIKSWVEGSQDQFVRSTRFASLSVPPWKEVRATMPGEMSRFERETLVEDVDKRFGGALSGLSARVITVRIYLRGGDTPISELMTVVTERP